MIFGTLGHLVWYRCRTCGSDYARQLRDDRDDNGGIPCRPACGACDACSDDDDRDDDEAFIPTQAIRVRRNERLAQTGFTRREQTPWTS